MVVHAGPDAELGEKFARQRADSWMILCQQVDGEPGDHSWAPFRVGPQSLGQEDRLRNLPDVHLQYRGTLAADLDQHLVGDPLQDGVQLADVVGVRPQGVGVGVLAGTAQRVGGVRSIEGEIQAPVDALIAAVGVGQNREAVGQVLGSVEAQVVSLDEGLQPERFQVLKLVEPGQDVVAPGGKEAQLLDQDRRSGEVVRRWFLRFGFAPGVKHVEEVHPDRAVVVLGHQCLLDRRFALLSARVGLQVANRVLRAAAGKERLHQPLLLLVGIVLLTDGLHCAEHLVNHRLTVKNPLRDVPVVERTLNAGSEDHRAELRRVLLSIAVNAAVALFDPNQAPRQVPMDQVVALAVQVHALGRPVTGQQQPHITAGPSELVHVLLLLGVRHKAVQNLDRVPAALVRLPAEQRRKDHPEPIEGLSALGEHHRPRPAARPDANLAQLLHQPGEFRCPMLPLGADGLLDATGQIGQAQQGCHLRGGRRRVHERRVGDVLVVVRQLVAQLPQSFPCGREQRAVRRQERFQQHIRKQPVLVAARPRAFPANLPGAS